MRHAVGTGYGLAIAALLAVSACGEAGTAQGAAAGPNDAPNPYRVDEGWAKLPLGRGFGMTISVVPDLDGMSMWVFDRCGGDGCTRSEVAPLLKFDPDGNMIAAIGTGLTNYPHGLAIDDDGNLWITDATGTEDNGHTVRKLSPTGEVLMTLGMPGVAGETEDTFNRPSSVAMGPDGSIYVGDGHGPGSNARVVKFDAAGNFVKTWGQLGTEPGQFDQPHAMAFDSSGRLFVGDRSNNRIQIFDQEGNFLEEWRQFGRPSGLFIDDNDMLYVADSQSDETINPGFAQGIRIGSVTDGVVREFIQGPDIGEGGEGVAADAAGNVYVGFTGGHDFKRFVK
jgi:DNA-binding beta-propeller fold protein YncE